jgi:hypothetical protein
MLPGIAGQQNQKCFRIQLHIRIQVIAVDLVPIEKSYLLEQLFCSWSLWRSSPAAALAKGF